LTTNYNTKATFNFQNQVKLEYTGYEDDIIKSIEAGNVSLPLSTSLITGSQSLFGIKTKLQFGRLMVTSVFSQQQGEKKEIEVQGGAQIQKFEIKADQYDQNRHFFLSHFFRDLYEQALANPPYINSPVNITKIEVWITNTTRNYENTRNVIAFQDLGEAEEKHIYNKALVQDKNPSSEFSSNDANTLYEQINANAQVREFVAASAALNNMGFTSKDYEKIQGARLLEEGKDYFVHRQLGYISLNQEVNQNQVLSVAFQYTYNGKIYQVGDFSVDGFTGQQALYTKMLMNTQYDTKLPMWDLMMKNVYSIGAYQVQKDGFQLEVWYLNPKTGLQINYLPEGPKGVGNTQLIRVLNLDRLNVNNDTLPDGYFDFIDNPLITINPKNGKVYFPVLEPFGSHLRNKLQDNNLADKYAFDSLYTTIQANAQVKFPDKNRFYIKGQYKSSVGSEISLNAINIPQGSVVVTAGGQRLVENQDYTVDYNLGRVTIINQSLLESGMPIKVSLESNSLFNIQTKTLFGSRFDYTVSKDLALGGTIMNLTERPITQKVNIGNEAMANTIVGLDGRYKTESQLITKILDKFPLLNTKETSSLTLNGEVAYLIPGHSRAIDIDKKEGTSYIDDFEGSQSTINLKTWNSWKLASIPQGQNDLFPEAQLFDSIAAGFNRAKLAWYVIDPLFFRNNNLTPAHIKDDPDMQSNHFMREVLYSEVFPNKSIAAGTPANIPVLDLAFYPNERGPYNYDTEPTNISAGINEDGTLAAPETRWGGIMRQIQTSNFEASNVQFIQFWVMDPYAEAGEPGFPDENTKGTLYINLGNISEDILRDS
ncbi:MAG: cell surface protein SprA, partial [Bacteroidetes bacterium]